MTTRPHVPECDLSLERAILGSPFLEPDTLEAVLAVSTEHFFDERHRVIHRAMRALRARGRAIDSVTLTRELTERERLDDVGGPAYLGQLFAEGSIPASLGSYIEALADLWRKRRLSQLGAALTDQNGQRGRDALAMAAAVVAEIGCADAATHEPTLRREGLDLSLTWPNGIRFALASIRDGREGVKGELTITMNERRVWWTSWSLASTAARSTLAKALDAKTPGPPWDDYLEDAAFRLTQGARQGEPLVTLTGRLSAPTRELVPRFLYEGEPTLVFGDGDTGKSLTGAALAVAVRSGCALPFGLKPIRSLPVAYLDWETSSETVDERVALLSAGFGIDPPPIVYKRMLRPLADEIAQLAAEFARRQIGFVIADSMMFAVAGGEGAAFHEPITAFYNALRLFAPAATLVFSHVTGADARSGAAARPYGGAFAFNGPRLIWEAKRDRDVIDATAVAFTCIKANNLARRPDPLGLRFEPAPGAIRVAPFDLSDAAPQATAGASLPYKIRLALAANGRMTTEDLIQAVSGPEASIRTTLRRLAADGKLTRIPGDRPSDKVSWELPS